MNQSPAFQLYPKDWLSSPDVTIMTPAQEGVYFRLLCYQWLDPDCTIPADPKAIAQLARVPYDEWCKGGYDLVITKFQPHPNLQGRLRNERLEKEHQKQVVWRNKSSEGGQKSAAKRWGTRRKRPYKGGYKMVTKWLQPNCNIAVCSLHLLSTPIVPEDVYNAYPRRVGKPKALAAIEKAGEKICHHCLLERTKAYAKSRAGQDENFTPHPSTWFNQERFNDDPATWNTHTQTNASNKPSFDRNAGTFNALQPGEKSPYADFGK